MSTPSPEAIEAGAKALYELAPTYTYGTSTGFHSEPVPWERVSPDDQGHIRSMSTAALTAAAPHVEAQAKGEALREAADLMHAKFEAVDYGHWRGRDYCEGMEMAYAYAEDDIRARAASIEGRENE